MVSVRNSTRQPTTSTARRSLSDLQAMTTRVASAGQHHHTRTDSHSLEVPNGVVANAATNARETFLNYFFGNNKDGAMENSVIMPRQTEQRPSDHEKRQSSNARKFKTDRYEQFCERI